MTLAPVKLARRLLVAILLGVLTTCTVAWTLTLPQTNAYAISGFGQPITDARGRVFLASVIVELTPGRDFLLARAEESFNAGANHALRELIRSNHRPEHDFGVAPPPWFAPMPPGHTYQRWGWRISGWPFRCLRSCSYELAGDNTLHLRGGIHVPRSLIFETPVNDPHRNSFPFLPWWPGLLANTTIFTAPWALLLFTPPLLRRTLRLRRGHCLHCGYDIQRNHSSPCPECGQFA